MTILLKLGLMILLSTFSLWFLINALHDKIDKVKKQLEDLSERR